MNRNSGDCDPQNSNYSRCQQKWLDQKKREFSIKLKAYYRAYAKHLRDLKKLAGQPNPHEKMKELVAKNEQPIRDMERQIGTLLTSIQGRIRSSEGHVRERKSTISKNNQDIDRLKRQLNVQEKKILEKQTELESKKKQLEVGSDTNKYRKHILYLLIIFNVFLVIVIVFLLKKSGGDAGDGDGDGAGEPSSE